MANKFVTAIIARNAPHLDEPQAAELYGMGAWEFERWATTLDDPGMADLVVQLQEWEKEAKDLLGLRDMRCNPCLVEFAEDGLKVWARRMPFGEKLAMPTTGARKASSPFEAAMMVINGREKRD